MGGSLSCISEQTPHLERKSYDMTPITSKNLPIIWINGPRGSGRGTHARLLSDSFELAHIKIADLARKEAEKDTTRGRIINLALRSGKRIPDIIVIELIKEEMLAKTNAKGYLIDSFPKNSKQAATFIKEIGEVDSIISLMCEIPLLLTRVQFKAQCDEDNLKKTISVYLRDIKEGCSRYTSKLDVIDTSADAEEVANKIEATVSEKIRIKTKIRAESDYAQSQEQEVATSIQTYS